MRLPGRGPKDALQAHMKYPRLCRGFSFAADQAQACCCRVVLRTKWEKRFFPHHHIPCFCLCSRAFCKGGAENKL